MPPLRGCASLIIGAFLDDLPISHEYKYGIRPPRYFARTAASTNESTWCGLHVRVWESRPE